MKPELVILDDSDELREVLIAYLQVSLNLLCSGYSSFTDFIGHGEEVLQSRVAIIDLELGFGQPSGIEALNWLQKNNYKGKVVFFTGHGRSSELVQQALKSGVVIWEKPMVAAKMTEHLRQLLKDGEFDASQRSLS